jgi:hypothetical protein
VHCQLKNCSPTTKKEELCVVEYVSKIWFLGDEMTAAGKQINDDKLITYLFFGLDQEYNSIVTTLLPKETLTIGDVYSQLLNFEQQLVLQKATEHYSMAATHGRGSIRGRGGSCRGGHAQSTPWPQGRGARHGGYNNHSGPHQENRP